MKTAISISIGSSKRDKTVEIELLGEKIRLERRGTDGDMDAAAELYRTLDGKVDAFGVGGAVLGLQVRDIWYPLQSCQALIKHVKITPVVDGTGFKTILERKAAGVVEKEFGNQLEHKRALIVSGVDRYALVQSFTEAGYETLIGDLMFAMGIPIAMHTEPALARMAKYLVPILSRVPFEWLYPTGEEQEKHEPKYISSYEWASVLSGDCHYITRYLPHNMHGKIVVTNTTTADDRELFKKAGIKHLITTTPMLDGRSFGTNMMEAALVALMDRKEAVDYHNSAEYLRQLEYLIGEIGYEPEVQELI
ncbi:MAG: hypothetical protein JEZ00_17625 [Anaerolineaceae bacterium]|nr:hypothetical protein [Anaerolineaceae bacterium]